MEALNLPSQPTYWIGSRLARQVRCIKLKLWIWPKKNFIDLFCPQNIQANRPGCRNSLNFFWKALPVGVFHWVHFFCRSRHSNQEWQRNPNRQTTNVVLWCLKIPIYNIIIRLMFFGCQYNVHIQYIIEQTPSRKKIVYHFIFYMLQKKSE